MLKPPLTPWSRKMDLGTSPPWRSPRRGGRYRALGHPRSRHRFAAARTETPDGKTDVAGQTLSRSGEKLLNRRKRCQPTLTPLHPRQRHQEQERLMRRPLVPSPPDVDAIKEGVDFSVGGHLSYLQSNRSLLLNHISRLCTHTDAVFHHIIG